MEKKSTVFESDFEVLRSGFGGSGSGKSGGGKSTALMSDSTCVTYTSCKAPYNGCKEASVFSPASHSPKSPGSKK